MYKIIGADQKEYGPVSPDQIRQWIAERRLNGNSLLQEEGSAAWKPLSAFPEFAAALPSAAPIAAGAPLPVPVAGAQQPNNPMAVAGLVCGILAVSCCPCGALFSILGITFSCIALSQIKTNPSQGGKSLATVGLVLSGVGLALCLLGWTFGIIQEVMRQIGR